MILAPAALASVLTWNLAFSGSNVAVNGTLTTDSTAGPGGGYLVTGLDLYRNGIETTSLLSTTSGFVDNLLFPSGHVVDQGGIGYSIGTTDYAFYYNSESTCGTLGYREDNGANYPYCNSSSPVITAVSLTPANGVSEPGTLALALAGLGALLVTRRRIRA